MKLKDLSKAEILIVMQMRGFDTGKKRFNFNLIKSEVRAIERLKAKGLIFRDDDDGNLLKFTEKGETLFKRSWEST